MSQTEKGYYQKPRLLGSRLYFLSEGDLWWCDAKQALEKETNASRLTVGLGSISSFAVSASGKKIVFLSTQEGSPDLYVMEALGGLPKRLTYITGMLEVIAFKDDETVIVRSAHASPFSCLAYLYAVNIVTGDMEKLPVGPCNFVSFSEKGQPVIGRHGYGYVSWKRYRGGTAGEIWARQEKNFIRLFENLKSNLLRPLCVKNRLYFQSDHEGVGSLYSSKLDGSDLARHTHFSDFYVREIATDGATIVYQKGADLWWFDPVTNQNKVFKVNTCSVSPLKARYFASAEENLTDFGLKPSGESLCLTTRGRLFVGKPFGGAMLQLGKTQGTRYRLGTFLDEKRLLAVKDEGLSESLYIFDTDTLKEQKIKGDWGRLVSLKVSPCGDFAAVVNHSHTLFWIALKDGKTQTIAQSAFGPYQGVDISPDSCFVVYSLAVSHKLHSLYMWDVKNKKSHVLTQPVLGDYAPVFDAKGRYIFFLSARSYDDKGSKLQPFLLTLQKDLVSPFSMPPDGQADGNGGQDDDAEKAKPKQSSKKGKKTDVPVISVDIDGIEKRSEPFPLPAAHIKSLWASGDKVFLLYGPGEKAEHESALGKKASLGGDIKTFDLASWRCDHWASDVMAMRGSAKGEWLAFATPSRRLRVVRAMEKPDDEDTSFRKGGWFDGERVTLEVDPSSEWRFMFAEAWRLQRDLFWDPQMQNIQWEDVRKRYEVLLPRLHTPADLMDLIGEMQGELGSSHAYVWGFDQNAGPDYRVGLLGVSTEANEKGARIKAFVGENVTDPTYRSPALAPGVNLQVGDIIEAVDGQAVSSEKPLSALLVAKAGQQVALRIKHADKLKKTNPEKSSRLVFLKPAKNLEPLRYQSYVMANQAYVHQKTKGSVGYIHIPDMSHWGYQAFFKTYAHELEREALILDVRFNRGGMISTQILSQLMRKRLGYDQSRHEGKIAYMFDAPQGPMVALCNEYTASDGDMFSHAFKKLKLGPLIGKRTWGGVIGIFPKYDLLDGSWTSQPEYAIWFHDVGWRIENQGAEPDIVVPYTPDDALKGVDPQLEKGIEEALLEIKRHQKQV